MITLATLPQATAQEVFDQVSTHLLTQKERSTNGSSCLYLDGKGNKCAAGCLISEDEYCSKFEGKNWNSLNIEEQVPDKHQRLICRLQLVHDYDEVVDWKDSLERVAITFGLDFGVLENF